MAQVAPLDEALGVQPHQRTSGELQSLGWALAIFVPFATAARWLGGTVGRASAPGRCGVGCKRLATKPWRISRQT